MAIVQKMEFALLEIILMSKKVDVLLVLIIVINVTLPHNVLDVLKVSQYKKFNNFPIVFLCVVMGGKLILNNVMMGIWRMGMDVIRSVRLSKVGVVAMGPQWELVFVLMIFPKEVSFRSKMPLLSLGKLSKGFIFLTYRNVSRIETVLIVSEF